LEQFPIEEVANEAEATVNRIVTGVVGEQERLHSAHEYVRQRATTRRQTTYRGECQGIILKLVNTFHKPLFRDICSCVLQVQ
jgi:hypothetical protein